MEYCMVCARIDQIKTGKNPYFVKELNTGYFVNAVVCLWEILMSCTETLEYMFSVEKLE